MSVDMVVSTEQTNLILTDKKASCRECHHTQSKVLLFLEREYAMAYISCEKELEDYICNHQDEFILVLKNTIYGEDCDIKFLGSQVKIGESNIADLIYYYDEIENDIIIKNYIIVELKFRYICPKDLSQISRYMNCLKDKLCSDKKYSKNNVFGLLVSFGEDKELQEICANDTISDDISFLTYKTNIKFDLSGHWYNNENYINSLKLDDRIENLYKEVSENDRPNTTE